MAMQAQRPMRVAMRAERKAMTSRISKGQKDLFILEKFGVPAGGKTAPAGPALRLR